jgi:hypothetical protein
MDFRVIAEIEGKIYCMQMTTSTYQLAQTAAAKRGAIQKATNDLENAPTQQAKRQIRKLLATLNSTQTFTDCLLLSKLTPNNTDCESSSTSFQLDVEGKHFKNFSDLMATYSQQSKQIPNYLIQAQTKAYPLRYLIGKVFTIRSVFNTSFQFTPVTINNNGDIIQFDESNRKDPFKRFKLLQGTQGSTAQSVPYSSNSLNPLRLKTNGTTFFITTNGTNYIGPSSSSSTTIKTIPSTSSTSSSLKDFQFNIILNGTTYTKISDHSQSKIVSSSPKSSIFSSLNPRFNIF